MSAEIELKLAVATEQVAPLVAWLEREAGTPVQQALHNIYLDTPDLALHRQRAALRLREVTRDGTSHWVQTLKTAGRSLNGLAVRNEWECPVADAVLEPERLPAAAQAILQQLTATPTPIFRTDFIRHAWRVAVPGGKVEIAFDDGAITLIDHSHNASLPIRELELEWLGAGDQNDDDGANNGAAASGDTAALAEAALRMLAARLHAVGPCVPSDVSKAERGYQLYLEHRHP